ncbi:MAG: Rieske (2Fe-2S) protein [Chlorobi bacterium]|nr:Rieske (2Fe-2S) protein [Chlorobiota bacterium]MCI0716628.1 Rieske (2Fe-2S) protein [Chlorobiota bacterium]
MNISRKDFLKKTTLLSGGLILLPVIGNLSGCSASAESTKVTVSPEGIIKYNIAGTLKNPGDGELLELEKTDSKILLIKKQGNSFTALNSVCTHKGCELVKKRDFLDCPCHGSEFDFSGKVIKGPASEPLQSFKTEFDGKNTVTIFLK